MRNIPTVERTDAELDAESALFSVIDKQLVEGSPRHEKIRLMIRLQALRAELDAVVPAIRESALSPDDLEAFWSKLNRYVLALFNVVVVPPISEFYPSPF